MDDIWSGCDIWSYEHKKIVPNSSHVVLVNLPVNGNQIPQPRRGQQAWDQDHVRLPSHNQSQYMYIDEAGQNTLKPRWDMIEESLLQPITSSFDLEIAIKKYNSRYEEVWDFSTLHEMFDKHLTAEEVMIFYDKTLPQIINIALQLPVLIQCPIPLLKQGINKSVTMSQQQVACLLANAFLCTFPRRNTDKRNSEYASFPSINFNKLYCSRGQNVIEKLKCIINYFNRVLCDQMPPNLVTFERISKDVKYKWESSDVKLSRINYLITSEGRIEDGKGMLQVDFANRFVGGGVLGHGCVQEEIRFLINPEMIVGRLFTEFLGHEEALIMVGCEQFNLYKGYASSFQWAGNTVDHTPLDSNFRRKSRVVAIDALSYQNNYEQFKESHIRRELNKTYVGFHSDPGNEKSPVATGLWGCGAFNGSTLRSALIQLMTCSVNGRNLVMFTFGDEETKKELSKTFKYIMENDITVGSLYQTLKKYRIDGSPSDPTQLGAFIKSQNASSNPRASTSNTCQTNRSKLSNFHTTTSSTKNIPKKDFTEKEACSISDLEEELVDEETNSALTKDGQKFFDVENRFKMFKKSPAPPAEKPQKKQLSLVESLDDDMKSTSSEAKTKGPFF